MKVGVYNNLRNFLKLEEKMAKYVTEQKTLLLDFLKKNCEASYTIDELMAKMSEQGVTSVPGKSTLYRLMNNLCDDGRVKRIAREGERSFAYQAFLGEDCGAHLHMKCISCGKLLHLEHELSHELLGRIRSVSDFSVSESETLLFGNCSDCRFGGKNDQK